MYSQTRLWSQQIRWYNKHILWVVSNDIFPLFIGSICPNCYRNSHGNSDVRIMVNKYESPVEFVITTFDCIIVTVIFFFLEKLDEKPTHQGAADQHNFSLLRQTHTTIVRYRNCSQNGTKSQSYKIISIIWHSKKFDYKNNLMHIFGIYNNCVVICDKKFYKTVTRIQFTFYDSKTILSFQSQKNFYERIWWN